MAEHDYRAAFASGHKYNELVGEFLRSKGISCDVPPLRYAATVEERSEFTRKEKDIVLPDGSVIEVKGVSPHFTWEPESYSSRPTIIVDTLSGFEGKEVTPFAYVFVSRASGAMLFIDTRTRLEWKVITAPDKSRGLLAEKFLIAQTKLLTSMEVLVWRILEKQSAQTSRSRSPEAL